MWCRLCEEREAVTSDGVCSICAIKYPIVYTQRNLAVPMEALVIKDYRRLNQKERKLVYKFVRAVISQNKENIDACVALLGKGN